MTTSAPQFKAPILIFPAGMARSIAYLAACKRRGQATVGASSLAHDLARESFDEWAYLPYISASDFDAHLLTVITKHGITQIFTPNNVVWGVLNKRLPVIAPQVSLVNATPAGEELSSYRFSRATAPALRATSEAIELGATTKPALSSLAFAALFHHAQTIPGMCDNQKFAALCQIARHCPQGDVVEIGSWWGKSAFILSQLASHFAIGNLLCVDPWSDAHLVQGDDIVDATSATVSADEAFAVFLTNLIAYNHGHINYLRAPSVDAAVQYVPNLRVQTQAFGSTQYQGKIAILHIDANHAYDAVNADTRAWAKFVIPGGWIIFDDYKWPYGDGPQRVADAFCVENVVRIEMAFFMGGTMFVRLKANY